MVYKVATTHFVYHEIRPSGYHQRGILSPPCFPLRTLFFTLIVYFYQCNYFTTCSSKPMTVHVKIILLLGLLERTLWRGAKSAFLNFPRNTQRANYRDLECFHTIIAIIILNYSIRSNVFNSPYKYFEKTKFRHTPTLGKSWSSCNIYELAYDRLTLCNEFSPIRFPASGCLSKYDLKALYCLHIQYPLVVLVKRYVKPPTFHCYCVLKEGVLYLRAKLRAYLRPRKSNLRSV